MIPNAAIREVVSSGVTARGAFGLSTKNSAHLMGILRDQLYSDKILAVIREYSSNAWDANREVGRGDKPIKVTLPTHFEPTFIIRDYGPGMSEDTVFKVYTQYGDSTKRFTNETVGMLGIGSKAGFAYSDSFTITSYHGGMKRIYSAVLDKTNIGEIQKLGECACGDETGVEIKISVKSQDIGTFRIKALGFYQHFDPLPECNVPFPQNSNKKVLPSGFVTEGSGYASWVVVMGCVPYNLNLTHFETELRHEGLWDAMHSFSGGLYVGIGGVEVAASREELKYSDLTKETVLSKIRALMQEYIESMLSVINSTSVSDWDKRIGAHAFKSKMKMEIPKEFRQWTRSHVSLAEEGETGPKTFTMRYFGSAEHVVKIPVERGTRLVLKDDPRPLSGFDLNSGDLVVLPVKGADIKPEIDAFIASKQLTGIPMVGISTLDFNAKSVRGRSGGANKKYTARMFRLVSTSHRRALSENWAIEDREPQDTDVFVVMESFIPADVPSFYTSYASDKALVAEMGLVMPEVYGYKSTQDKPVRAVNCKGIAYEDWRKSYILGNMTERYKKLVAAHGFTKLANWGYKLVKAGLLQELEKNLGMCHPVTELYRDYQESWALREKASLLETELAGKVYLMLYPRWDTKGPEQIRAQQVWSKYPLISGFDCFDENDMWKHYFHYIHLIDKE